MGDPAKRRARAKLKAAEGRKARVYGSAENRGAHPYRASSAALLAEAKASRRSCGSCQLCCVVKAIEPVEAPSWVPCTHQCGAGCGIYEERPQECQDYLCLWRQGWGEDFDRPDRTGVLVDLETIAGEQVIVAREEREGALHKQFKRYEWFAKRGETIVAYCRPGADGTAPAYLFDLRHPPLGHQLTISELPPNHPMKG